MKKVTILMGSDSDKNIADKAIEVLENYGVPYELQQASAHREPDKLRQIVLGSDSDVFICIAGLSAALPGVTASMTQKPVIGVPVDVKLGGLDALLSIAQMPSGVPVATVGIDNGKNAAYLAMRILGVTHSTTPTSTSSYAAPAATPDFFKSFPVMSSTPSEPEEEKKEKKPSGDWLSGRY